MLSLELVCTLLHQTDFLLDKIFPVALDRYLLKGEFDHDRRHWTRKLWFRQLCSANTSHNSPAEDVSKLRLTLWPSRLHFAVQSWNPSFKLSEAVTATYIDQTIRGMNPSPTVDVRLITSRVRPRRVRPVRWQIKGCQTILLVYGTPKYLLVSQCVP